MAELTGGQLAARTLRQAGVGHVFTLCGGHILPIYDGCLTEGIGIIDVRHEQAAAHVADAYAYITDPREIGPTLERALASDEVWCINVVLDPEAYRKSGQVSMAI